MDNPTPQIGPPGLFGSLRSLLATGVSLLKVRLELLSTEVQEAQMRFLRLLVLAVIGIFLLCMGVTVGLFLAAAAFWDTHRLAALGVLAVVLIGGGAAFLFAAGRQVTRHRFLASTLSELERDRRGVEGR